MGKLQRYVVIDLETTGHASRTDDKIIEIGIVVIEGLEIVQKYSTFVNPMREIPPFIQSLTNISNIDVEDAPLFEEVAVEVKELFQDSYLIAHNVIFDLGFLNDELNTVGLSPLTCPTIDTVELARILLPQAPSYKLSEVSEFIHIEHDQPHRAISDALVTAELFIKLMKKLKALPKETIAHLIDLEPFLQSDLHNILHEIYSEALVNIESIDVHNNIAFKKIEIHEPTRPVLEQSFNNFLEELYKKDGLLKQNNPKYEHRTGQKSISEKINQAFNNHRHGLIEAGTGIGKTIAYLIPAIHKAVEENTRVVVSTYTTQLQNQILYEEIPFLRQILPFTFDVALLKGRRNYLSLERFSFELHNTPNENYDIVLAKAMILVWITESNSGDLDEIQLPSGAYHFHLRVCAIQSDVNKSQSSWKKYCYYKQAKNKAESAHIIISNHALLCNDLKSEIDLIPSFSYLIIDEAHQFDRVATDYFGKQISYFEIQHILNRLGTTFERNNIKVIADRIDYLTNDHIFKKWNQLYRDLKYELDDFYQLLHNYTLKKSKQKNVGESGSTVYHISHLDENDSTWRTLNEMANRIKFYLIELQKILKESSQLLNENKHENEANIANVLLQQLLRISSSISEMFSQDGANEKVRWLEVDNYGTKNSVHLFVKPVAIGQKLKKLLFQRKKSIILTSASLSVNGSFDFIKNELGFESVEIEEIIPSPFNYVEQAKLLVPTDFPSVQYDSQEDYVLAIAESVLSLAEVSKGRILVLFTAFDMLKETYGYLKELLEEERYMLFAQGISGGSRERLKKNFQTFENSILLGTSSFWEGVDIANEALKVVVMARLPFEPPNNPFFQAREKELIQAGKNPFMQYSLPRAVMRFKQGFGRLIRHRNDHGIILVCDERIMNKSYGKYFINSLPEITIQHDTTKSLIESVENWL